jgi:hypothetical protein
VHCPGERAHVRPFPAVFLAVLEGDCSSKHLGRMPFGTQWVRITQSSQNMATIIFSALAVSLCASIELTGALFPTNAHFSHAQQYHHMSHSTGDKSMFRVAQIVHIILTHSHSWALLKNSPIEKPLKNFPAFYRTQRFITVFKRALPWSLSWATWIQSIPSHLI